MGIGKKIINRAIFFDRDGIIIKAPVKNGFPKATKTIGKIKIIPGIKKICKIAKFKEDTFYFDNNYKFNKASTYLFKYVNTYIYKYNFINSTNDD